MAEKFQLDIVSPEKSVFSGKVDMVTAPGGAGEFGVLHGHANFITTLEIGGLRIKIDNEEIIFASAKGFAEVSASSMIILSDAVEKADEIDVKRAEAAKAVAEKRLEKIDKEDSEFSEVKLALLRAENRIRVSGGVV